MSNPKSYIEEVELKIPEIRVNIDIPAETYSELSKLNNLAAASGTVFKSTAAMVDQLDADISDIEKHLNIK